MAPGSRASCPPRTMNEEARAMGVQPVVPIRVRARPQCIFSQSPHHRAACIFSLGRPTFATLRPNLAYFRILSPYVTLTFRTLSLAASVWRCVCMCAPASPCVYVQSARSPRLACACVCDDCDLTQCRLLVTVRRRNPTHGPIAGVR